MQTGGNPQIWNSGHKKVVFLAGNVLSGSLFSPNPWMDARYFCLHTHTLLAPILTWEINCLVQTGRNGWKKYKCLSVFFRIRKPSIIWTLSQSIVKKKLVLYGDAAKLGIKSAVERDVLAVSGWEINSTRGRGNRQFPLVHPTQLKPPKTVSGCEMRGSS